MSEEGSGDFLLSLKKCLRGLVSFIEVLSIAHGGDLFRALGLCKDSDKRVTAEVSPVFMYRFSKMSCSVYLTQILHLCRGDVGHPILFLSSYSVFIFMKETSKVEGMPDAIPRDMKWSEELFWKDLFPVFLLERLRVCLRSL